MGWIPGARVRRRAMCRAVAAQDRAGGSWWRGVVRLPLACLLIFQLTVATATATAAERTFHRTGTDDPATVDPHRIVFPGEQLVVLDLFMSLTTYDNRGRPVAGCAERSRTSISLEPSNDMAFPRCPTTRLVASML